MPYPKLKDERYSNFKGVNTKASKYLTGPNEALEIINWDLSKPGALTKAPGTTQYIGATTSGRVGGFYEFDRLSGASYVMVSANTNMYTVAGNSLNPVRTGLTNGGIFDFVTFVDRLFATNGSEFFKFDGSNTTNYSLPPGATPTSLSASGSGGGLSGTISYAYGYLNDRGYFGPAVNFRTTSQTGSTQIVVNGLTSWSGYGISAIVIYRGYDSGPFYAIGTASPSATSFTDTDLPLGTTIASEALWVTMAPQSIELYNNQLFLVGFSAYPSTFMYSDIAEPESVQPDSNEEVRTNDGDYLTAAKAYYSQLVLFKTKSTHALAGEDPDNFSLREVTDQYGCLSKRAAAVWEQRLWFLDQKGVFEFDGSNISNVSAKIEDIFRHMNIPVAKELSQMIHVKDRNEVWTSIPADGASFINTVVVYDYIAEGWWYRKGVNICSMGVFTGSLPLESVGFGGFSGSVHYFGSSLFTDNGMGMTLSVRFPFDSYDQHSTEHEWRRLWIDLDPSMGATKTVTVNFYKDQGSSYVLQRTNVQSEFQNRIEFGIPSKDLSVEFIHNEDQAIRLNGYTLAHRYQRDV